MRQEHFERLMRRGPALGARGGGDPAFPWEWAFAAAVNDGTFWHDEFDAPGCGSVRNASIEHDAIWERAPPQTAKRKRQNSTPHSIDRHHQVDEHGNYEVNRRGNLICRPYNKGECSGDTGTCPRNAERMRISARSARETTTHSAQPMATWALELSCAYTHHLDLDAAMMSVSWRLPATKTDAQERSVVRSWGCLFRARLGRMLCPYHTAGAHLKFLRDRPSNILLFPRGDESTCSKNASSKHWKLRHQDYSYRYWTTWADVSILAIP
eukprot:2409370-Amphidinium_carterae.1